MNKTIFLMLILVLSLSGMTWADAGSGLAGISTKMMLDVDQAEAMVKLYQCVAMAIMVVAVVLAVFRDRIHHKLQLTALFMAVVAGYLNLLSTVIVLNNQGNGVAMEFFLLFFYSVKAL